MIQIPALRGDDALGFLAAIGLCMLAEQAAIQPLTLSWTPTHSPTAIIDGPDNLQELQQALDTAFQTMNTTAQALPGIDDFPLPKRGSGTDPMRMPPTEMQHLFEKAERAWFDPNQGPWLARWTTALCAQTAVDSSQRTLLTPFYAPFGQMALRNSIYDKTMQAVTAVAGPGDALTSWRRTDYAGANFDERALRDAGTTTTGKPSNQGAPSPTWLAAMGIRAFPITDSGTKTATVGWQQIRLYPGYTTRSLIWPTWQPHLDPPAIRALLAHPALQVETGNNQVSIPRATHLKGLDVTAVYGASRRTLTQGDGPLGPVAQLWPTRT